MVLSPALATITPSGNRVVEQVTQAIAAGVPGLSTQFTRIPVYGDTGGVATYDWERMVDAATLLSHARPNVICWNGTKGGALGFEIDRDLCRKLTDATGIATTTAALSIIEALARIKAQRIAIVTPYETGYQDKCIAAFRAQGFDCVAERHSGLTDNLAYGEIAPEEIIAMTRSALSEAGADAIIYFCTNFPGAAVAPIIEAEFDGMVLDSTALGVWGALQAAALDARQIQGWGRVFNI